MNDFHVRLCQLVLEHVEQSEKGHLEAAHLEEVNLGRTQQKQYQNYQNAVKFDNNKCQKLYAP